MTDIKTVEMGFVNAFLLKGKSGFVLIDTGMPQHWEKLESDLISAGCLPDKLNLVVITHGDIDHIGNCAKLQEKYKAKIAMHQADSFMAEQGIRIKRKVRTLRGKIRMLIARLRHRHMSFDKFKPDLYLTDGQSMNAYGLDAQIIHIPGHTKGSIGILTTDGDFFAGDTFTNNIKPDISIYINNMQDLKKSIEKLKKLNIKTVYPGHGKPFPSDKVFRWEKV